MLEGEIALESAWRGEGVVAGWELWAVQKVDATLEQKTRLTGSTGLERGSQRLLLWLTIAREWQASFLVVFLPILKDQK
jgi:hypothetical protein